MYRRITLWLAVCGASAAALCGPNHQLSGLIDLAGHPRDPLSSSARVRVCLFVRTDCPITNRYAPELQRLATEFQGKQVQFWLIYPDPLEKAERIGTQIAQYGFPGEPLRDPHHEMVKLAHATVAPEAAVFDEAGRLAYHGRIDDRWVDVGKSRPVARTHDLEDAISAVLAGKAVAQPETRAIGCSLADVE